jgi:hypothetical protein
MLRKLLLAVGVCVFSLNLALAAEIKGKVKSVDGDKNTITLTVDDKDQTFDVDKDAKIYSLGKKKKGQPPPEIMLSGLRAVLANANVTITTEKKGDKDVATSIKVETTRKKKKIT